MIRGVYDRDTMTLRMSGHAGYAPYGYDVVCAGVSTLVYTLINTTDCRVDPCDDMFIHIVGEGDSPIIAEAVARGLDMLSQRYPDNFEFIQKGTLPYHKK